MVQNNMKDLFTTFRGRMRPKLLIRGTDCITPLAKSRKYLGRVLVTCRQQFGASHAAAQPGIPPCHSEAQLFLQLPGWTVSFFHFLPHNIRMVPEPKSSTRDTLILVVLVAAEPRVLPRAVTAAAAAAASKLPPIKFDKVCGLQKSGKGTCLFRT
jgi:hypothetical protein